jgi:hypothetical protein
VSFLLSENLVFGTVECHWLATSLFYSHSYGFCCLGLMEFQSLDPSPESLVERSMLRQCLENALAAELSPHERDVLRLRHGLDDGISRSVREVVDSTGGTASPADIRNAEHRAYLKLRHAHSKHNMRLVDFASDFVARRSSGNEIIQSNNPST